MTKMGDYSSEYPIVFEQRQSRLYKMISYIVAWIAVLLFVLFLIFLFSTDYNNIPALFMTIPFITIFALTNLGNCDEIVILKISEEGFSINFSNRTEKNQKLHWKEIDKIIPPNWNSDEGTKITIHLRSDVARKHNRKIEMDEFLNLGGPEMYKMLKWHWIKNS